MIDNTHSSVLGFSNSRSLHHSQFPPSSIPVFLFCHLFIVSLSLLFSLSLSVSLSHPLCTSTLTLDYLGVAHGNRLENVFVPVNRHYSIFLVYISNLFSDSWTDSKHRALSCVFNNSLQSKRLYNNPNENTMKTAEFLEDTIESLLLNIKRARLKNECCTIWLYSLI